uniref:NADH-ubiquinone oxidoreductase chain 2 n=1 Tax=Biomphalaria pfeifferi TaxID=112525 RepID=A0A2U8J9G1_BIOPF|nr:NADH dehydrogenase subunit 2 [Biomphalaria pfeifferi]AWK49467.1 NADH dehydrogenase subunit 2 [Biomphalaria pfeifferi]
MNSSNLLFFFVCFISPIISLSSSDWIISWIGMEVGMIALFPLLLMNYFSSSKESMMKYFLIQSLASVMMFISGIIFFNNIEQLNMVNYLFLMSLSLKLGIFPGHFWVPSLVNSLSWISNMMLLGPLKIAPMGFLSMLVFSNNMMHMIIILGVFSAIIGSILGNNQTSVRSMIGSSSISHSGWMCVGMCFGYIWGYMLMYLIILMFMFYSLFMLDYLSFSVMLLSLSGLPPFIMFLMKMKILFYSLFSLEYFIFIMLILSSIISLNFYLKFFYSYFLMNKRDSKFLLSFFCLLNLLGITFVCFFECNFCNKLLI